VEGVLRVVIDALVEDLDTEAMLARSSAEAIAVLASTFGDAPGAFIKAASRSI